MNVGNESYKLICSHWAKRFKIDEKYLTQKSEFLIIEGDHPASKVNIFVLNESSLVILNREIFESFTKFCKQHKCEDNKQNLDIYLESISLKFNPPDLLLYLVEEKFTPKRVVENIVCRKLEHDDSEAFKAMEAECSKEDLNAGYVSLDDPIVYGAFIKDKLICFASSYLGESPVADIGVVTHPEYRRKSIGAAVVSSLCKEIFDRKKIPQYRVQPHITGSLKLAQSIGFEQLGQWIPEHQPDY